MAKSSSERQKDLRTRKKEMGLVRRDVFAHPDDWPEIRNLEKKLQNKRVKAKKA
jgi:hypothetical protein